MTGVVERGGIEAVPSREIGGRVPGTKEVEGQLGVREEGIPEIKGKVKVGGGQNGYEVVLKCADSPFGGVSTVVVGGNVLYSDGVCLGAKECSEVSGAFVVSY